MKYAFALLTSTLASITTRPPRTLPKREICTVQSQSDPLFDDVPAITSALAHCGDSGRIVLPANQTFTLRSPLDLSGCRACDIQINGLLKISGDWDIWSKYPAAIKISNVSAAIIHSEGSTGVIDAQNFGWAGQHATLGRVPSLFSVEKESYQIHVRDLKIRNAPGTVFRVRSNSSAVRFYGVEVLTEARTGWEVENSRHVYLWNDTIRVRGENDAACVRVLPDSSNVQLEETRCLAGSGAHAAKGTPSGIELNFGDESGAIRWIRHVVVRKVEAVGRMNVIAFLNNRGDGEGEDKRLEVMNATFSDISIDGPAKRAVLLDQRGAGINATGVRFVRFNGTVEEGNALECERRDDVCGFEKAGWSVEMGR